MITQSMLREHVHYDPDTGLFTWRIRTPKSTMYVGDVMGSLDEEGYIIIKLQQSRYRAHRLAFLYMEGYMPEPQVDHKNGIRNDNRWCNLREVGAVCNKQNQTVMKTNRSGCTGVSWCKAESKWKVGIRVHGKTIHLGYYDCKLDAALARYTFEDWCPLWHCDLRNVNRQNVEAALQYYLKKTKKGSQVKCLN